jgi:hypothetical protein
MAPVKLEANTTFFLLSQGGWYTEKFGRKAERDDEKTEVKSASIRFFFCCRQQHNETKTMFQPTKNTA